ncbi:MAG: RtcB family protein [Desulfovibrionaceae bacterium]|nr:RtcB family protein [Desulfovibrionaceae bacterium]
MQKKYIRGKFAEALLFLVDNLAIAVDEYALAQIKALCDFQAMEGNVIRIMPDVHPGNACVVGLTMVLTADAVMPNLVGADIGCGVSVSRIEKYTENFTRLDRVIADKVPSGFAIHDKALTYDSLNELCCARHVQLEKARRSLGTLGGGNHFCEIARDSDDARYLVIHTGSRHLGKEVCEWYLKQGKKDGVPYELTWIQGDIREQYLHDMKIVQDFACANRLQIAQAIAKGMKWKLSDTWESVHNYIDFSGNRPILRKGAISAAEGERVIIPINMRDGSLVGFGKGNAEWNWSAPHGSGRIQSRAKIREQFTLSAFKKAMKGVYSTCVAKETLDEAPFAYRPEKDIAEALRDTVEIRAILRPVYNFKAGSKQ